MDVSNNEIRGGIANSSIVQKFNYAEIDLSSNQLEGPLSLLLFNVAALHISRNQISSINSFCDATEDGKLSFLDMSYNQLSEKLHNCWLHFINLIVLNLANNHELTGEIPTTLGSTRGVAFV